VPSAATALVDVNTSPVQPGSPNSRKVTVPVGMKAPTRLAVSRTAVPTGPPGDAAASSPGVRLAMTIVNVWHAGGPSTLLPHTVVGPKDPAADAVPVTKPSGRRLSPGGRDPLVIEKVGCGVCGVAVNLWR
jgi:hypothetical protein